MKRPLILLAALVAAASSLSAAPPPPGRALRWVYLASNFLVDKNVEEAVALVERSARAGYTGVVLADSKFMRWDELPQRYADNVRRVRDACRAAGLDCIACVFPMGYSNDLLSRDPNLAAGLPVVEAPFIVRGRKVLPADDSAAIANGGFEQSERDVPAGWRFVDQPGKITFIDTQVRRAGQAALRMQDIGRQDPKHGHGPACQTLQVRPFRYYHISAYVKTENFEAAGDVRIAVLGEGGVSLQYADLGLAPTQDWKRVDVTFNSLECSEVNLYLGVWGGRGGTIWWDDVRLEPGGLVNVVRRPGAPFRLTSEDGQTVYEEIRDFAGAADPLLGRTPYAGEYGVWHDPPVMSLPPGSRLADGQKVLASYYHTAIIYGGQVTCCMSEPKVYEILAWQADQVHRHLNPDGYFMQHDEIRVQGYDASCAERKWTPGEILADNVRRCAEILRAADPGKRIYVWSDMFDPTHNAGRTGRYYLVKGDGPWYRSWDGLPKDVTVVNWHGQAEGRVESLQHFASLGLPQILAGYYDGPPGRIRDWLADTSQVAGVIGVMYTTWEHRYDDLETFAAELQKAGR